MRTKTETVYLSGQITGLHPEEAAKRFDKAYDWVCGVYGDETVCVNPLRVAESNPQQEGESDKEYYTRILIKDLEYLSGCDTVAMLPFWQRSKGATLEHLLAVTLDKKLVYLPDWIAGGAAE